MTEHLNKRFKDVLVQMNDPEIKIEDVVFHSIRHTSTGLKLKLSGGDLKAVQGDGGWNTPDMVTKRYAHILDEDRRNLATEVEEKFYQSKSTMTPPPALPVPGAPAVDASAIAAALNSNPNLLIQILQSVQLAKT